MTSHVPAQLGEFEHQLSQDPALVEEILQTLPPVEVERERIIRCSPENLERAICRAFARCREWGEHWRIEVIEQ